MGTLFSVEKQLTISTSIYGAGDVVGGLQTLNMGRLNTRGILKELHVFDDNDEEAVLTLYLMNELPSSPVADQAAFTMSFANMKKIIGTVPIANADYVTIGADGLAIERDLNIFYHTPNARLYAYLVATATPTYAATTDLVLRYIFEKQ